MADKCFEKGNETFPKSSVIKKFGFPGRPEPPKLNPQLIQKNNNQTQQKDQQVDK
jgi:hypothetical protein